MGCCDHGSELSGSIRLDEFLNWPRKCLLLKKIFPWKWSVGRSIGRSVPSCIYVHRPSDLYNKHTTCKEQIIAVLAGFFIVVTSYGLVVGCRRFGRIHCLSLQGRSRIIFSADGSVLWTGCTHLLDCQRIAI